MCGHELSTRQVEDKSRPFCPDCGFVVYLDPKVAAGTLIEQDGCIVLLKRAIEPGYGQWTFPGGYVDRGEPVEAAAIREAREEVGLEVAIQALHGVYSFAGVPVVIIVYRATVSGGRLQVGEECLEVNWTPPQDIPWDDLAFESTQLALRKWVEQQNNLM